MSACKHSRVLNEGSGRTRCLLCDATQASKNGAWLGPLDRLARRRGHLFLPDDVAERIPALYETERLSFEDKLVHVHYFVAAADWYVVELDQRDLIAFAFCDLGDRANAEWGYVELRELASMQLGTYGTVVERDLTFAPRLFSAVLDERAYEDDVDAARRARDVARDESHGLE